MSHYTDIVETIPHGREVKSTWLHKHGGIVLSPAEGAYLESLLADCGGIHVDIGTYFGGSAILAALSKPDGMVYSIDACIGGHWNEGIITLKMVQENLSFFGVEDRIALVKSYSHPWPADVIPPKIETVFIDAAEKETGHGGSMHDWLNTKDITTGYIIFHDCRDLYPGVQKTVRLAEADSDWYLFDQIDSTRIFKHR